MGDRLGKELNFLKAPVDYLSHCHFSPWKALELLSTSLTFPRLFLEPSLPDKLPP